MTSSTTLLSKDVLSQVRKGAIASCLELSFVFCDTELINHLVMKLNNTKLQTY